MNETSKTGIFWGVALVALLAAIFVAWPQNTDPETELAGRILFEDFKDPLAASSLKITSFDEEQGALETFEVRKDTDSELWTIASRDGYPADAIEQVKEAATSLVDIKILDVQTRNAEDHAELGVAEPRIDELQVGDEGVGRLITFKDATQETLASLIVGDEVKDDPSKRYVRIPGQDPVYVIKFDESTLTTNFRDWIEDDLLQLSSIDIADVEIKDYTAALGQRGSISVQRNYTATVAADASDWELVSLLEYDPNDPRAEPTPADIPVGQELNAAKLNDLKNALDDLKIADVFRKPAGMSSSLKADKTFLNDADAINSLAKRGFFPVAVGPEDVEIISANGELSVSTQDGVRYSLRFGNISSVDDASDAEDEEGGVNRYLLVTTEVDESKFPVPDLQPIPKTLEELDALLNPPAEGDEPAEDDEPAEGDEPADPQQPTSDGGADDASTSEMDEVDSAEPVVEESGIEESGIEESGIEEPGNEEPGSKEPGSKESGIEESGEPAEESTIEGQNTGSGSGGAQDSSEPVEESEGNDSANAEPTTETTTGDESVTDDRAAADEMVANDDEADDDLEGLTEEELLERLEAEQEKITKQNQRLLDQRKDNLEAAQRRVRELNARFADWYYVIPESTYGQLTINRDELVVAEGENDESDAPAFNPGAMPQFNFPQQ